MRGWTFHGKPWLLALVLLMVPGLARAQVLHSTALSNWPTKPTTTCTSTSGSNYSTDIFIDTLTANTTYVLPAAASTCLPRDHVELFITQGTNQAFTATVNIGANTIMTFPGVPGAPLTATTTAGITGIYQIPASTAGATDVWVDYIFVYDTSPTPPNGPQWRLVSQITNPPTTFNNLNIVTTNSLCGLGTLQSPLGICLPLIPTFGGTGSSAPTNDAIAISEGPTNPFNFVTLGAHQILAGVGSNIDPAATSNFTLGTTGHIQVVSNPPVITACGVSPSVIGADNSFTVSIGSGSVQSCKATFVTPMPGGANCTVSTSTNLAVYSAVQPAQVIVDPSGNFVTIQPQAAGGDIGCETVTVRCDEIVSQ